MRRLTEHRSSNRPHSLPPRPGVGPATRRALPSQDRDYNSTVQASGHDRLPPHKCGWMARFVFRPQPVGSGRRFRPCGDGMLLRAEVLRRQRVNVGADAAVGSQGLLGRPAVLVNIVTEAMRLLMAACRFGL